MVQQDPLNGPRKKQVRVRLTGEPGGLEVGLTSNWEAIRNLRRMRIYSSGCLQNWIKCRVYMRNVGHDWVFGMHVFRFQLSVFQVSRWLWVWGSASCFTVSRDEWRLRKRMEDNTLSSELSNLGWWSISPFWLDDVQWYSELLSIQRECLKWFEFECVVSAHVPPSLPSGGTSLWEVVEWSEVARF